MQARTLPNVVCKFYAKGYCKNGWTCAFVHETLSNHDAVENETDVTVASEPCRYFIKGKCLKGDRCNFSHDKNHIMRKDEDNKGVIGDGTNTQLTDISTTNNNNITSISTCTTEIENKESSEEEKYQDLEHSKDQPDLECSICLESVLKHHKQFGLLPRCDHVFCLDCIRSWRQPSNTIEANREQHHVCPICRVKSFYVVPSSIYATGENKKRIIYEYRQKLRSIPCKYYRLGRNACPFADRCFYLHGNIQSRASATKRTLMATRNNNVNSAVEDIASEENTTRHATSAHRPGEFKYERIGILARAMQYARALRRGNEAQYGQYEEDYRRVQENEELNLELAAIVAKDGNGAVEDPSRAEDKLDRAEERGLDAVVHQHDEADSDDESEYSYETGWD